ncbi:hypothetical protein L5515_014753 [Caenorhabditis briggsae]|uniref:C-type lectin domain-containing protein n=1 Tax=Caenorhabditis briggsae TaxID=6238 RepID=A0AAE9EF51_CAEBR|nr:hypothetical protein L5515_014753 [Caenorhabditis briggsae]
MRSILIALTFLAFSTEAIFRPGYGGGGHRPPSSYHGGHDNCKTSQAPTTPTTPVPTTPAKTCPEGFKAFERVPSEANSQTSVWCMGMTNTDAAIKISDGDALCSAMHSSAVPTMFENDAEREYFATAWTEKLTAMGQGLLGSVGMDGRLISECKSKDKAILESDACSGTKSFVLRDKHTDPSYAWTIWAETEPNHHHWTFDIEECIQFAIWNNRPNRSKLLNDIYCNMTVAPNDPANRVYWNFGMICGMLPI